MDNAIERMTIKSKITYIQMTPDTRARMKLSKMVIHAAKAISKETKLNGRNKFEPIF